MEVKFARTESVADAILRLIRETTTSIHAALYRLNHPGLVQGLHDAVDRGVRVQLVVDGNKYAETRVTQEMLAGGSIPFRRAFGRRGRGSKMHHKFVILDQQTVLAGSYNWTQESEVENHENLMIVRDAGAAAAYKKEFEALWAEAAQDDG